MARPLRRRRPGAVTEVVGTLSPPGPVGVSTGRGWEVELSLCPWRFAPPPGVPLPGGAFGGSTDPGVAQPAPLTVRGPVTAGRLDELRATLPAGATVRVAGAVAGTDRPTLRLEEVVAVEPPDPVLENP